MDVTVEFPRYPTPCILLVCCLLFSFPVWSQVAAASPAVTYTDIVPADLLVSRSIVLNDPTFSDDELNQIQKAFQQIGIDAVAYFEKDVVLAGRDVTAAFVEYFTSRQIRYLLIVEKTERGYRLTGALFNQKSSLFDPAPLWRVENARLGELLQVVFQDSWRSQKKRNFLVAEFPETDIRVNPIKGNRQQFYAIDLKVDLLAVPRSGDEVADKELEEFFKTNYPLKYKLTAPNADERELRRQGFAYILCYVHTRGIAARELLGYDMTKGETAYASISFSDGQLQLKTIPADAEVYKYYFRHIDNGNVFLGTKWDADITWMDALRNHILGFKNEAKIN